MASYIQSTRTDFLTFYFYEVLLHCDIDLENALFQNGEKLERINAWLPYQRFSLTDLQEKFSLSDIVLSYKDYYQGTNDCHANSLLSLWEYFSFLPNKQKNQLIQSANHINNSVTFKRRKRKVPKKISNQEKSKFQYGQIIIPPVSLKLFTLIDIGSTLANIYYRETQEDTAIDLYPSIWTQPPIFIYPCSLKDVLDGTDINCPNAQTSCIFSELSKSYQQFCKHRIEIRENILKDLVKFQFEEINSCHETADAALLRNVWKDVLPRICFIDPNDKFKNFFHEDYSFEKEYPAEYKGAPSRKIGLENLETIRSWTFFSSDEVEQYFTLYYGFGEAEDTQCKIEPCHDSIASLESLKSQSFVITYLPYILYSCISSLFLNHFDDIAAQDVAKKALTKEILRFRNDTFSRRHRVVYSEETALKAQYENPNYIRDYKTYLGSVFAPTPSKSTYQRKAEINFRILLFRYCMEACTKSIYNLSSKINFSDAAFLFLYDFSQDKIDWDEELQDKFFDEPLQKHPKLLTTSPDFFYHVMQLLWGEADPLFFTLL